MSAARARSIDELIDSALMSRLDRLDVVSRKIFAGKLQGERRSKRRGRSVEFADFRPYVHGDDLRFVDWNIYGRLDRLFLKMFLEEEDLSLLVVIDATASMASGEPEKFAFAQRLAMALGYVGLVNRNRVTLASFGGAGEGTQVRGGSGVRRLANLRGRRRTREMGQWLLDTEPVGGGDFAEAMKTIALARQGRGVMVLLSDLLFREGYERGLNYAAGRGFDVFALQVLSPQETDPAAHGIVGDLRLVDVEDGGETEITATPAVLERYRSRLEAFVSGLREFCVRRNIMHVPLDTTQAVDAVILETLRRRGLVR
jgi:uncharacterized protein (DUF58 family)